MGDKKGRKDKAKQDRQHDVKAAKSKKQKMEKSKSHAL